jgi:tRNA pseudouridine55 synthase
LFGILLIWKDVGRTSHDVVDVVRRKFGTRRVGHAGTLDPLATGLLVVAVGPATRFLQYLPLEPKEYVAHITFGRATTTYDMEGESTQDSPVPTNLEEAINLALPQFKGLISQLPPMYSAVKKAGKPLYQYARQGKEIEREPRNVHIETFDIKILSEDTVEARIVCSGGTYIRSLAHDLGQALGCGAHLSKLHRTKVGRFTIEALLPMPLVPLNETQVHHIREGRQIGLMEMPSSSLVGLLDADGEVFSVARVAGDLLQPECVIPSEAAHGVS